MVETPYVDLAFQEYGMRYLVVPGAEYRHAALVEAAGLPQPLPEPIVRLFAAADDVGHHALARGGQDPVLTQWNPYCGAWPYHVRRVYAANQDDTRWMIRLFEDGSRCLFDALHESTHGQLAAMGQMGLLGLVDAEQREAFNTLSEAIAVLIGDVEGHGALMDAGYLHQFWPPSGQRSHAVALDPREALRGAGFVTSEERSRWLFDLYLSGREGFENLVTGSPNRVLALAFLVEESGYAQKVRAHVGPTWERLYWKRPEIEAYIRDFVPPIPVELPHIGSPIASVDDVRAHWHGLTLGWEPLPPAWRNHLQGRLSIQRHALKVCELESAIDHIRCRVEAQPRAKALERIAGYRATLQERFGSFENPRGQLSDEGLHGLRQELHDLQRSAMDTLIQILGPVILLDHPWLDDSVMAYRWPSLSQGNDLDQSTAHCQPVLERLIAEARATIRRRPHEPSERLFEEAHGLLGRFSLRPDDSELLHEFKCFLGTVRAQRRLVLPYALEWSISDPYVEPRDGFRYT